MSFKGFGSDLSMLSENNCKVLSPFRRKSKFTYTMCRGLEGLVSLM